VIVGEPMGECRRPPSPEAIQARAHLLYGEWLRRERRQLEARRAAAHGARHIREHGFRRRSGGAPSGSCWRPASARKRTVRTREDLAVQEAQVARLARDGLANAELGARLFISPRTVEYHLHKVLSELGIDSRNQLELALPRETEYAVAV
jgi:DNA-binding NarL/FixJ family response regulator